jgi:3-methyl-2-oxobutanoate hydroxymethyltransferase
MSEPTIPRVTIPALRAKKAAGEKIVALTAYDHAVARIVDAAGADLILVGDSLGMVVLGYADTLPVTMEEMLHHLKPVARAARRALVIGDMPFLSYHESEAQAVANAGRFIKEGGAQGVKIEGASPRRLKLVETFVEADISVLGHIGLTPQSVARLGGFKVQGKTTADARRLIQEAASLERAGAFAVVLECIPAEVAGMITSRLTIPTIGIGAGPLCDGQIIVFHDLVGYHDGYLPKFVRKYADLHAVIGEAVARYGEDVRRGEFPNGDQSYHLKPAVAEEMRKTFGAGPRTRRKARG